MADLLPKALSEDETGRLLGAVVGTGPAMLRDRALLELLYGTGARVSEVVGLNLGDVAEAVDGGDIPLIRVLGKGGKERVVPLGRLALAALQQWLSGEGRPHLETEKWKPAQRRRSRLPQRPRGPAHPGGGVRRGQEVRRPGRIWPTG